MHSSILKHITKYFNPNNTYVILNKNGERYTYDFVAIYKDKIIKLGLRHRKRGTGGFYLEQKHKSLENGLFNAKLAKNLPILDYNLQIQKDGCDSKAEMFKGGYKIKSIRSDISINGTAVPILLDEFRFINIRFSNILKTRERCENIVKIIGNLASSVIYNFVYYNILSPGVEVDRDFVTGLYDQVDICIFKYSDWFVTYMNDDIYCLSITFSNSNFAIDSLFLDNHTWLAICSNKSDDIINIDGDRQIIETDMEKLHKFLCIMRDINITHRG